MVRLCFVVLLMLMLVTSSGAYAATPTSAISPSIPSQNPLLERAGVLTFRVTTPGMVTIRAVNLAQAGWSLSLINPAFIHASRDDREVALEIVGGGDGRLDGADALRLLVTPSDSRWTSEAVYWLWFDTTPGLRAAVPSTLPNPYTWEQDARYDSRFATLRGDRWFATELRVGALPFTTTLTLPAAAPVGSTMKLFVHGVAKRANHQLIVSTAGRTLGTLTWDDGELTAPLTLTLSLPVALPAGTVPLTIRLVTAGSPADAVLLDRIVLPAVTMSARMVPAPALTPYQPLDLRQGPAAGQAGATFLIITHASLHKTLAPLIAAHRGRGDTVGVVDIQAAYDTWSSGETDPEALRTLIRTAVTTWQPPPRAVLLVGAGSVRLRAAQQDVVQMQQARALNARERAAGRLSVTAASDDLPTRTSLIPPYLVDADPLRGEIACDTCYTRLDHDDVLQDVVPDLSIGRLPVRDAAEAQTVIAKTVTALTKPPSGAWQRRALFLADNDRETDGTPDPAGAFTATAETGVSALPSGIDIHRFYYAPDRAALPSYDDDVGRLRCRMFRLLDGGSASDTRCAPNGATAQTGAALLTYVGHGSPWQWGATALDAEVPYLWYLYDADARRNGERLPILLNMTCLTGDWANSVLQTTDERLLLHRGGGIVAALSAAGQGVNTGHARLLGALLPRLYAPDGGRSLGAAHLAALQAISDAGTDSDLAYSFNVLGDPDVALPFVPRSTSYLPLVGR